VNIAWCSPQMDKSKNKKSQKIKKPAIPAIISFIGSLS
jgi:hypothetical protein